MQEPEIRRDAEILKKQVIQALKTCYDPEIPVNIYELGLVYDVQVEESGAVTIRMTLTSPNCPVAGSLPGEVESKVKAIAGVTAAAVELVWDPMWTPSKMSEAAKLALGMDLDMPAAAPGGVIPADSLGGKRKGF
jgi:FeS assembly SUF system protein